jgi:hypothetical protein
MRLICLALFPAWLLWGAIDPAGPGSVVGQIVLGVLVAVNTYLQIRKSREDRLWTAEQRQRTQAVAAKVDRVEKKTDVQTDIVAEVARKNGTCVDEERLREMLGRYNSLVPARATEGDDAERRAKGVLRPDHSGGEGGPGGVLPPVP